MRDDLTVERHILPLTSSLKDVLTRLNEGVSGIVCIVDEDELLCGICTDGDVRRAMLDGADMSSHVDTFMNRQYVTGHVNMKREDQLALLDDRIRHVPLVDDHGRVCEVITWAEIWKMPLVEPSLAGNELKYVTECIRTNWISSQGTYVTRFEESFANYHRVKHAVASSSGTTALHLGLLSLGIGPGDEVLVPDLTFGASANAVIHVGAEPVFVDVDCNTWTIDVDKARLLISEKTKAVMPVHLYGVPCQMDDLIALAKDHDLKVIEDCAEALGACFNDRLVGTFGNISAYSFFANKTITTGEGGMVLTNDETLAERMRIFRDHGMRPGKRYWHDVVGFNYRMTNIQSAIGCAQMERLDKFLERRKEIAHHYYQAFSQIDWFDTQYIPDHCKSAYWLFSMMIDRDAPLTRDQFCLRLAEEGIDTRPLFYPLHEQPAYEMFRHGECQQSKLVSYQGFSLPTSNHMTLEDADRVVRAVRRIVERNQWLKQ